MNESRSPRKHPLVAGALAAALACVGAIAVAASPASARPYGDCTPAVSYTITNVSTVWKATDLNGGKPVRRPGKATIPWGRVFHAEASGMNWLWRTGEIGPVFAKVNALYPDDVVTTSGNYTTATKSVAVPRGKTQRLQLQILERTFTAKKYAATDRVTCARGRLLYSVTVTAPLTKSPGNYTLRYALV